MTQSVKYIHIVVHAISKDSSLFCTHTSQTTNHTENLWAVKVWYNKFNIFFCIDGWMVVTYNFDINIMLLILCY